ncbi:geranylgeranyl reductase family protein [Candidatus Micrarchaeota archaeon]|nr:geranylgeranyl reductase family protein [Candidatus Micrarchaeota archaeon]
MQSRSTEKRDDRMKYDYDAVVIGGGPAGSTFARVAAESGMEVLVVDKRKEIGVPVRCGEGLRNFEVIREGLELPKACYSAPVEGTKVYSPDGTALVWKTEGTRGWVLERKTFDKWLCELAVDKGAKVRVYTRAVGIIKDEKGRPGGVRLSHGGREPYEVRAPLVVSAEGMESMMARQMGFKTVHQLYDVDTCYQYEMGPYPHENLIELYFGNKIAPRGYVWIFPKAKSKANVGIGIGGSLNTGKKQGGMDGATPKRLLDDFISSQEKLKIASTLDDFGGVISVGAPLNEFVQDNCMVIGTAAKQVDPTHGGGIALAMESGVMAAKFAAAAHQEKDYSRQRLAGYEKQWKESAGKKVAKRLLVRKVLEKLSDDDLNHIFNSIAGKDLEAIMAGKFAGPVAKVVATRPQLLGVLGALMPEKKEGS